MFSMLFAAIFLWVLDNYGNDKNSRVIWWLVPAMILWVNMHAGFAVGLALTWSVVGVALDDYILEKLSPLQIWRRVRQLVALWIVTVAAVSINPNGPRLYSYPFETLRSGAMMRYIQEWSSRLQDPAFLALLVLIIIISVFWRSHRNQRDQRTATALRNGRGNASIWPKRPLFWACCNSDTCAPPMDVAISLRCSKPFAFCGHACAHLQRESHCHFCQRSTPDHCPRHLPPPASS